MDQLYIERKVSMAENNQIHRIEELVERLNKASEAYYNGQDEIMSNFEWDGMFDELTALEMETGRWSYYYR